MGRGGLAALFSGKLAIVGFAEAEKAHDRAEESSGQTEVKVI